MRWVVIGAVAAVAEAEAIHRHRGTLSELVATTYRVERRSGRAAFLASLMTFSAWFGWHIVRYRYSMKTG